MPERKGQEGTMQGANGDVSREQSAATEQAIMDDNEGGKERG